MVILSIKYILENNVTIIVEKLTTGKLKGIKMIYYILGVLFLLFSIALYQLLGMCLVKKESYSYSFIIGFIIYSFFVAILGMAIQVINLSWYYFFYGMCIIWLGSIIFILYNLYKKKITFNKNDYVNYVKYNWFFYVGAIILIFFSLANLDVVWSNAMTDDGYYVTLMSTLPYIDNPFRIDPTTGFLINDFSILRIFNTFELEGSFYIYVTNMPGTLYARLFLAILNYFIILNVINAFIIKLRKDDKIYNQYLVFSVFMVIIFNAKYLIFTEAEWTVKYAVYFGSALIRIICPFILLLPLIDTEKLSIKKIILTIISCIVMISKSTCAVPIIFVLAIGYLIDYKVNNKCYFIILLPLIGILGIVLKNNLSVENMSFKVLFNNFSYVGFYIALLGMLAFSKNDKKYFKISKIIIVAGILSFIPYINNFYELLTEYDFVSDRTWYTLIVFLLIIVLYSVLNIIMEKLLKTKNIMNTIVSFCLIMCSVFSSYYIGKKVDTVHFKQAFNVYRQNPYIIPQGTVDLGYELEKIYKNENIILKIVMSPGMLIDGYGHLSSSILRTYAPHIQSVTGGLRVNSSITNDNSGFKNFDLRKLQVFSNFENSPCEESLMELNKLNQQYPFNCLVIINSNDEHKELLNSIGYNLYSVVDDNQQRYHYGIFIK